MVVTEALNTLEFDCVAILGKDDGCMERTADLRRDFAPLLRGVALAVVRTWQGWEARGLLDPIVPPGVGGAGEGPPALPRGERHQAVLRVRGRPAGGGSTRGRWRRSWPGSSGRPPPPTTPR